MTWATGEPVGTPAGRPQAGFTLVELLIAITVLTLLAGIAVPAIDSVIRERQAREPLDELLSMAREARLRAMREQRPYQIVFDATGFRASRFFSLYGGVEEYQRQRSEAALTAQQEEIRRASSLRNLSGGTEDPGRAAETESLLYHREYTFQPGLGCQLKSWDELNWRHLSGAEFKRWIFHPSGMCEPLQVRMEARGAFFEVSFHPLTADIQSERSWVE